MQFAHHCWRAAGLAFLLLLLGCNSRPQPAYQGKQGLKFTPPSGWVERDRDNLLPARAGKKPLDLPMPGLAEGERMVVRYDRVSAGHLAWVRVTTADLPADAVLKDQIASRSPGENWRRELEPEDLEISKLPAARIAFAGRWSEQDFLCEIVAVRNGEQVYFFTASFPAADSTAREQVRTAVAAATWK
jgi:hypothetical protein